jgi:excisionase family DNA binding protein
VRDEQVRDDRLCVTVPEVAAMLGICLRTARKLTATGELPVIRIRGALRVPVADLHAWVKSKRAATAA